MVSRYRQYEAQVPKLEQLEAELRDTLERISTLYTQLLQGNKVLEVVESFDLKLVALEATMLNLDNELTIFRDIYDALETNVKNYRDSIEHSRLLIGADQDQIITSIYERLNQRPEQIKRDLSFPQRKLDQANRSLDIWRPLIERLSLADRDPIQLAQTIHSQLTANKSSFSQVENITIVFDDIKNSTVYADQCGDVQLQQLIKRHDDLLYSVISNYHGRIIKNIGDGSLFIFSDAGEAVEAAIAIQKAVHQANQTASTQDKFQVRIGAHTGRALVNELDILGLAVSIASRICNQADAGEIFISEITHQQAGDGIKDFKQAGTFQLNGLQETVILYRWPVS